MNNEEHCLLLMKRLPIELLKHIKCYISPLILLILNKKHYDKYHSYIKLYVLNVKNQYDNYVRDTIRRDNFFVFKRILDESLKKWKNFKNYFYKGKIYINYLYFLREYCCTNESDNCKKILDSYLFERGLSKNQHKKNLVKIIKRQWMN
uniref:Uncharacterized protein n=1 Tax=viral metagenome TaxID=1070528 RepID=A0A6C0KXM4_9ZZZZ